jgi:hypothetical protein
MMAAMLAVLMFKISPIAAAAINGTFHVLAEFETALSQLILPRAVQRIFVFELNYRELSSQYLASRENVAAAIISSGRSPAFKMLQQRRLSTIRVSLRDCMNDFAAILIDTDRGELLSAAIERFNSFKVAERASFQSGILGRALVGHIEDLQQLIVISLAQFDLIRQEAIGLKLDKVASHIKIEALEKFHAFGAVIASSLAYSDSVDIPTEYCHAWPTMELLLKLSLLP